MRYAANATLMNEAVIQAMVYRDLSEIYTLPEQVTLTTTLNCNYRCRMCRQPGYPKGEMSWVVVEKVVDVLPFVDVLQIFGGEPLLYSRNCFGRMRDESSINTRFSPAIAAKLGRGRTPGVHAA
jgi:MoaA/NifB/PqqE/SkfB family radical SAM enzyme